VPTVLDTKTNPLPDNTMKTNPQFIQGDIVNTASRRRLSHAAFAIAAAATVMTMATSTASAQVTSPSLSQGTSGLAVNCSYEISTIANGVGFVTFDEIINNVYTPIGNPQLPNSSGEQLSVTWTPTFQGSHELVVRQGFLTSPPVWASVTRMGINTGTGCL
jgi:hypothetical protein